LGARGIDLFSRKKKGIDFIDQVKGANTSPQINPAGISLKGKRKDARRERKNA